MSLGEIPGGNTRGYWKLSSVNDDSSNGFNFTNRNTVAFSTGKFTTGADFGSSGTNKGLTLGSNPFSSGEPTNMSFSFWVKLNTTASSNTNARLFDLCTINNSASGVRILTHYNISGSNMVFTAFIGTTAGARTAVITMAKDTNWHWILVRKVNDILVINIDSDPDLIASASALADRTTSGITYTYPFILGNTPGLADQAWVMLDEFYMTEYNLANYTNLYYTQARGMLV